MRLQILTPILGLGCFLIPVVNGQHSCKSEVSKYSLVVASAPGSNQLTRIQKYGMTGVCLTKAHCARGLNSGLVGFYTNGDCPDGMRTPHSTPPSANPSLRSVEYQMLYHCGLFSNGCCGVRVLQEYCWGMRGKIYVEPLSRPVGCEVLLMVVKWSVCEAGFSDMAEKSTTLSMLRHRLWL